MGARRIAVIGGGAAGLAAAWALHARHDVTLFERDDRLGGHAHTVVLADGPDAGTPLDVGFMVMNDQNYPRLTRLLAELGGIELRQSEMSFAYQSPDGAVQYALNWRAGYGADPRRAPDMRLLGEIARFMRLGRRALEDGTAEGVSFGAFLAGGGLSPAFRDTYALPMGAALWSSSPAAVLAIPAAFVLRFFAHHGMLTLDEGPTWQTIVGGSRAYVERIAAALGERVRLGVREVWLERGAAGVTVHAGGEELAFDAAVVATHADEARALLLDPDAEEAALLGPWRYQRSDAVLHSDPAAMPRDRGAWASWNYVQHGPHEATTGPAVTYHLDRLQGRSGLARPYFLTLNPQIPLDPQLVHGTFAFTHPVFTAASVATQPVLRSRGGQRRTCFCGSYWGYGFHEDAIAAGLAAAAALEAAA